jgi:hypothetical protein
MAHLFAAVAEERDGIAAEPPVDVERRAARWELDRTFVALEAGEVVGLIFVIESSFGFGEIAMLVAADWRGAEWEGIGRGRYRMGEGARPPQADIERLPAQQGSGRPVPKARLHRRGTARQAYATRQRGGCGT